MTLPAQVWPEVFRPRVGMIRSLKGTPLSNFAPVQIRLGGQLYPSVEAAFAAAKTLIPEERLRILLAPSPAAAKQLGRQATLREDWEDIKLTVMLELLRAKFQRPSYRALLLATGEQEIVEGNTWDDRFWGVCNGVGENHLGRLLMQVRSELWEAERTRALAQVA
ncbi:NADAR family protein [Deinococcus aquatilis]|uniref:NADAR family protein n=1 Tax=Deinococcus aquatilis TaxID=519440 RepID=UPI00035F2510|nr:NADAR family protein [Deinococcus aquatilis]